MLSDIACNGCDLLLGDAGAVAHVAHVVRELRREVRRLRGAIAGCLAGAEGRENASSGHSTPEYITPLAIVKRPVGQA